MYLVVEGQGMGGYKILSLWDSLEEAVAESRCLNPYTGSAISIIRVQANYV